MANRSRGTNMSSLEDEALCLAYVNVTSNVIVGNNQTMETFWEAVRIEYHNNPAITIPRPAGSLQTRYHVISSSVMLYVAKLSHALNNPESGQSEIDMVMNARSAYQAAKNKPFVFDRCYQILKVLPKFDLRTTSLNNTQASVSSNDASNPIDIELPLERPQGRKAAKQAKRAKDKADALATCQASLERAEKSDAEFLRYTREGHEIKKRMEIKMSELVDLRLLAMDTSRMNEEQLEIHKMKMAELKNRMRQQSEQQSSSQSEQSPSE